MAVATGNPFRTEHKDGVTYIYDHPPRTVYVDGFDWKVFRATLAVGVVCALCMALMGLGYGGAYIVAGLMFAGSLPSAIAYARVRHYEATAAEEVRIHCEAYVIECLGAIVLMIFAAKLQHVPYVGGILAMVFCGFALLFSLGGLFRSASVEARGGKEIPALPRVVMPRGALETRHQQHRDDVETLKGLPVFDAETPALRAAWERRETQTLETLLSAGAIQNRQSWDTAISCFNAAKDDVDLARGRLRALVKDAETALAGFTIDYAALVVDRSGILAGDMPEVALPKADFTQRAQATLAINGQVGRALAQGSWQTAAAGVVLMVVMHQITKSKRLRQLKAFEGQLVALAGAVQGDIRMIGDAMAQRVIPQFEALLRLIQTLELRLAQLMPADAAAGDTPQEAFRLACAMREAQLVLAMKAGD